jgi:hypothetical protein
MKCIQARRVDDAAFADESEEIASGCGGGHARAFRECRRSIGEAFFTALV